MDVTPFTLAGGEPLRAVGINKVGLRRNGFTNQEINAASDAFHFFFKQSGATMAQKVEEAISSGYQNPMGRRIAEFISKSQRGVTI